MDFAAGAADVAEMVPKFCILEILLAIASL